MHYDHPTHADRQRSTHAGAVHFRFTIRDVLWLTALVAMWLGWFLDMYTPHIDNASLVNGQFQSQRREGELIRELRRKGYDAVWDKAEHRFNIVEIP
jgi:hypothetical protein